MTIRTYMAILLLYLLFSAGTVFMYPLTKDYIVEINGQQQYLCWVMRDTVVHLGLLMAALSQLIINPIQRGTAALIVVAYAAFDVIMTWFYGNEYSYNTYLFYMGFICCALFYYIHKHGINRLG